MTSLFGVSLPRKIPKKFNKQKPDQSGLTWSLNSINYLFTRNAKLGMKYELTELYSKGVPGCDAWM